MAIVVKLIQLGSEIQEKALQDGANVGDLMDECEIDFIQGNVTRNQRTENIADTLYDGDQIFVGNPCKGNIPFEVKVVRVGSSKSIINLPCEPGMTIQEVLNQTSPENKTELFNSDGSATYEYRVGGAGESVDSNYVLQTPTNGSVRLFLSTRTKGNE